ncbi:protein FRA10AC1-like [Pollicipes pollicipes]|uniref:protein FRA10AC1-like n=1 Tax=Pollicipes pollicipes TaxID=41117 RepID=UPI001884A252|nr:protein FRA10AC1-like [Pollicipes pollicipes]XP_037068298.1 protein FRA10AC1-like [Pollicipes pollicipes]
MSNEYESAFEGDSEVEERRRRRNDLRYKSRPAPESKADAAFFSSERARHEGRVRRLHYLALNAYDRHKELINNYHLYYPGSTALLQRDASRDRTDHDVIREHHRFVWEPDDPTDSWERRLAKRYHDKLFREYCICDLTYYKLNKVAMRWRVEKEVVAGKGQFSCGSKHCDAREALQSWEVNFSYAEHGEQKNCLVKLRLCPDCSRKLNYHKQKRKAKAPKTKKRAKKSRKDDTKGKSVPDSAAVETVSGDGAAAAPSASVPSDTTSKGSAAVSADDIWKQPAVVDEEKSREEEFDEFLSELFL